MNDPVSIEEMIRETVRAVVREELDRAIVELVGELKAESGAPPLLDRNGAAKLLGVSTKTLDRLVKQGAPHVMIGDAKRFEPPVLVGWLRTRGTGSRAVLRLAPKNTI